MADLKLWHAWIIGAVVMLLGALAGVWLLVEIVGAVLVACTIRAVLIVTIDRWLEGIS